MISKESKIHEFLDQKSDYIYFNRLLYNLYVIIITMLYIRCSIILIFIIFESFYG